MTRTPPWETLLHKLAESAQDIQQPWALVAFGLVIAATLAFIRWELAVAVILLLGILFLAVILRVAPEGLSEYLLEIARGKQRTGRFESVSGVSPDSSIDDPSVSSFDRADRLEWIFYVNLYHREGGSVGRTKTFEVDYFLDLMTAALVDDHLAIISTEMVDHMRRQQEVSDLDAMIGPKRGNAILQREVARALNMNTIFVKQVPLFGHKVEGVVTGSTRAVLVDDIASDGELLVKCVEVGRQLGLRIDKAYVLVDRIEGDAEEALAKVGVELKSSRRMGDRHFEEIVSRARLGR